MATIRQAKAGRKRARVRRVQVGSPDPRLTPCAGIETVRELDRVLGITGALEAGVGAVKSRDRGLTGGQVLLALASCQLAGGDHLVSLDRRRADTAGQELEPVRTPASTTAAGIAKRFTPEHLAGIEAAVGQVNTRLLARVGPVRRSSLLKVSTIDGDTTDVQVYGRAKQNAKHAYTGALTLRPHITFWAEAGVPLAAEVMSGTGDPRSTCVDMLDRAMAALPEGVQAVRCRWDAGYFGKDLAVACIERGVEFAIGVKRTAPVLAAAANVPEHQWVPAIGMEHTQVAVIDYLPGQWPQGVACIARRTKIPAAMIPTAGPGNDAPSPSDSSPWPWPGGWTTCTGTASS